LDVVAARATAARVVVSPQLQSVAVLLGTWNGGRHIEQQLASLAAQTHLNWRLIVSDDGSTDDTIHQIVQFADDDPRRRVEVRAGPRSLGTGSQPLLDPRQPATTNFLSLLADTSIDAHYFALCDQDDVWHPEKLQRAAEKLATVPDTVPALYCSRTRLIGDSGRTCGFSPLFRRAPTFRNALVQSLAGGNTMVLNKAARDLVAKAGNVHVVAHDWWIYMLVSGAGGYVYYDAHPMVDYRQHADNLVGANTGLTAVWDRIRMLLNGGFARWMDLNLTALHEHRDLLSPENRALLTAFQRCRHGHLGERIRVLTRLGLYRQRLRGQAAIALAIIANRI
jgi:glycosyltransferase involved in cell wall biosynthesis